MYYRYDDKYMYNKSTSNGVLIDNTSFGPITLESITKNWTNWYIIEDNKKIFKYII